MKYFFVCALSLSVVACGGGGGPGGPNVRPTISSPTPSASSNTNFVAPVKAGSYNLFVSGSTTAPVQDIFVQDLNNDNKEEIVIAGRMSQSATELTTAPNQDAKNAAWQNSQISVFGWNSSNQLE